MTLCSKDLVSAILVRLAGSLKRLSDDEWIAIQGGAFGIAITTDVPAKAPRRKALSDTDSLVTEIVARLSQVADREEAKKALTQPGTTNGVLRGVARASGVHATSKDNKKMLVERIIESTVGFRLRASAIQGNGALLEYRENALAP